MMANYQLAVLLEGLVRAADAGAAAEKTQAKGVKNVGY